MRSEFESGIFGKEKDGSFESAISQIGKGFGAEDFCPTLEEKANKASEQCHLQLKDFTLIR